MGYRSKFRHDTEIAEPGYYKVSLDYYNIQVELTATKRVSFHKYTYPKTKDTYVIIGLYHKIGDQAEEPYRKIVNDRKIEEYIVGGHFCGIRKPHKTYFVIKFLRSFIQIESMRISHDEIISGGVLTQNIGKHLT